MNFKDKATNIGISALSFFDFRNKTLRKTRIIITAGIALSLSASIFTITNQQTIQNNRKEIKQTQNVNVDENKINQQISKYNPYKKDKTSKSNSINDNDQRLYTLSLMARNPDMESEKPQAKGNQGDPVLSVLKEIGTKPANQDGNLFQRGVVLTGGGMQWYLENQLTKDMNLNGVKIGFDPYNSTVYSNVELDNNTKQRIENIYNCCELVIERSNIKFKIVN